MSELDEIPQSDCVEGAPHPRETETLFGHTAAQASFLTAYNSNRLHHAWLITGPRGVGKATLAWKIARFLLAQPIDDGGMLGDTVPAPETLDIPANHPVSRRIAALGEPRLTLARRPWDEKAKRLKKNITVDEIRKLKSFFQMSATDGGYRVAIIDAADEMNPAAANALLKILEEPPEKTVLVLVCHQLARLLPTIRSRCRTVRCSSLSNETLSAALEQAGLSAGGAIPALASLSNGSAGEAVRLLMDKGVETYAEIAAITSNAPGLDRAAAVAMADKCAGRGAEAHFDMCYRLIHLLVARLARYGALQPSVWDEAAEGEARLMAKLAPNADAGRKWADILQTLQDRGQHARAVNLDPSSVILDMFLKIDQTARG